MMTGNTTLYYLQSMTSGNALVKSIKPETTRSVHLFIMKHVANVELIREVTNLQSIREKKEAYLTTFNNRLLEMKEAIELGAVIKGKCEVCRKF
jgi:hypothetical protein